MFQSHKRNVDYHLNGTLSTDTPFIPYPATPSDITERHEQTDYALLPWLCFELGLKYDGYFDDDQYHFSLQAGWEGQ